ncbi:hypothetical protein [Candidatus Annandia adelgestsuga]|uniref:hypothetical protein n=1 Tax=Candidatus Annandia adelgestsuga TaxID=1302411 RepID=UPI000F7E7110|nr:hypothetical protein [Candidatus Annandia adelgestsuga]
MIINTNWLNEFFKKKIPIKLLCKKLLILGIEIKKIIKIKKIFSKIIVGKIIKCNINKKNIYLLSVDIGCKKNIKISCNANNCYLGLKIAILKSNIKNFKKKKKY